MGNRAGTGASTSARPQLHELKPRELTGRDVIARFHSQFRGAAFACMKILEGKGLDRVYCDFQDDFVTRESCEGVVAYHFFQVKTKGSRKYQWTRLDLFGLPQKVPSVTKGLAAHAPGGAVSKPTPEQLAKLRGSFVGKLLEHTVHFGDACTSVTFLTNAYLDDDVEDIAAAISCGDVSERTVRFLADHYSTVFALPHPPAMGSVHASIGKLKISPGHDYLDPHHPDFESKAIKAVWENSEIDLAHTEGVELVEKLLKLIEKKSSRKLVGELTAVDLDDAAGVGIDDLLDLLPVSRGAYYSFLNDGDKSALKNASVLQRKLGQAGADQELIETASRWKVDWDSWFRTYRHMYEMEINVLRLELNKIYRLWARGDVSFFGLRSEVVALKVKLKSSPLTVVLTEELLTGGILAELVRSEAR